MIDFNLNSTYEFRWEDHLVGEDKQFARKYFQYKAFKTQGQAQDYLTKMLAGNMLVSILELTNEYDEILESCDPDRIEGFRAKNEFIV